MNNPIDATTSRLVLLALDAAALTQQVSADNIANANTPNFARGRVEFGAQLEAVRRTLETGAPLAPAALHGLAPRLLRLAPTGAPNHVAQLDAEAATQGETQVRYQALLKAWSKQASLLALAVNEGRR